MLHIEPFRPLRYSPEAVSFISRVLAPPYDVMDAHDVEEYEELDRHNVVRLILGKEPADGRDPHVYEQAAGTLRQWVADGVLIREDEPSVYVVEESFSLDREAFTRRGLICLARIEEFERGTVLPHEQTHAGPKADRMKLMRACRAALSPVFGAFTDRQGWVDALLCAEQSDYPLYEFGMPEGVAYRVWRVTDPVRIGQLQSALREQKLLIADGHHRYETAVAYRDECRPPGAAPGECPEDYVLLYGVSVKNSGLRILPTHRLVKTEGEFDSEAFLEHMRERFELKQVFFQGPDAVRPALAKKVGDRIGCYLDGQRLFAVDRTPDSPLSGPVAGHSPEWRRLAVTLLHHGILEPLFGITTETGRADPRLTYMPDAKDIYWNVEGGRYDLGFFLPPIDPETVVTIADSGERLPPKSTYFYPKILSGLALHSFDPPE